MARTVRYSTFHPRRCIVQATCAPPYGPCRQNLHTKTGVTLLSAPTPYFITVLQCIHTTKVMLKLVTKLLANHCNEADTAGFLPLLFSPLDQVRKYTVPSLAKPASAFSHSEILSAQTLLHPAADMYRPVIRKPSYNTRHVTTCHSSRSYK